MPGFCFVILEVFGVAAKVRTSGYDIQPSVNGLHRESDFLTFKAITEDAVPEIRDRRPDIPPGLRAACALLHSCLLYTSPSPRDRTRSRMPSSA